MFKKKWCGISIHGSWFLIFEFPRGVTQFCSISMPVFSGISKVWWQILKFQGSSQKSNILNSACLFFSGISYIGWYTARCQTKGSDRFVKGALSQETIFGNRKHFKNDKSVLFHLKSSLCSQDTWIFVLTFRSCSKMTWFRKVRLISNFLTSQPGLQSILKPIFNISRSKDNQTKFGQLIEYNIRNKFLEKS